MLGGGVRLCAETAEKPYFKRFSGIEKAHRNSIKITVDLWRRARDSNPRSRVDGLHDFQSCSFDQLGQLSVSPCYYIESAAKNQDIFFWYIEKTIFCWFCFVRGSNFAFRHVPNSAPRNRMKQRTVPKKEGRQSFEILFRLLWRDSTNTMSVRGTGKPVYGHDAAAEMSRYYHGVCAVPNRYDHVWSSKGAVPRYGVPGPR